MQKVPDKSVKGYDSELNEAHVNKEKFLLPARYIVEGSLGRGSFGAVCKAMDTVTNEHVAIKKIRDVFPLNDKKVKKSDDAIYVETVLALRYFYTWWTALT
ncbi:kinase-domain conntaining protein [Acrasis kona]|uniref:Kinase-domain conntaining protein n=1 Tax=Acrasis kona TaxID=1008807 RepID=A0AAW2ZED1_9EUKA